MTARITSASLTNYGNAPSGSFSVHIGDTIINYSMTKDEAMELMSLLFTFIHRRKSELADAVRNIETPALLEAPKAVIDDLPF